MLTMLSDLNFSFSLIGLSETKIKSDKNNLLNISIPGYNFLSQPSSTNAGGVGFYVKSSLNHTLHTGKNPQFPNLVNKWFLEITNLKPGIYQFWEIL